MNLLQETLECLKQHEKVPADVRWVGSLDGQLAMTWDDFKKVCSIEYDDGFGGQEIASDLVVVGDDWWLERSEYDGSEWWEFQRKPEFRGWRPFDSVGGGMWDNLSTLNQGREPGAT